MSKHIATATLDNGKLFHISITNPDTRVSWNPKIAAKAELSFVIDHAGVRIAIKETPFYLSGGRRVGRKAEFALSRHEAATLIDLLHRSLEEQQ